MMEAPAADQGQKEQKRQVLTPVIPKNSWYKWTSGPALTRV